MKTKDTLSETEKAKIVNILTNHILGTPRATAATRKRLVDRIGKVVGNKAKARRIIEALKRSKA